MFPAWGYLAPYPVESQGDSAAGGSSASGGAAGGSSTSTMRGDSAAVAAASSAAPAGVDRAGGDGEEQEVDGAALDPSIGSAFGLAVTDPSLGSAFVGLAITDEVQEEEELTSRLGAGLAPAGPATLETSSRQQQQQQEGDADAAMGEAAAAGPAAATSSPSAGPAAAATLAGGTRQLDVGAALHMAGQQARLLSSTVFVRSSSSTLYEVLLGL